MHFKEQFFYHFNARVGMRVVPIERDFRLIKWTVSPFKIYFSYISICSLVDEFSLVLASLNFRY